MPSASLIFIRTMMSSSNAKNGPFFWQTQLVPGFCSVSSVQTNDVFCVRYVTRQFVQRIRRILNT